MVDSPTFGQDEKYPRVCGDAEALYDEVGFIA